MINCAASWTSKSAVVRAPVVLLTRARTSNPFACPRRSPVESSPSTCTSPSTKNRCSKSPRVERTKRFTKGSRHRSHQLGTSAPKSTSSSCQTSRRGSETTSSQRLARKLLRPRKATVVGYTSKCSTKLRKTHLTSGMKRQNSRWRLCNSQKMKRS